MLRILTMLVLVAACEARAVSSEPVHLVQPLLAPTANESAPKPSPAATAASTATRAPSLEPAHEMRARLTDTFVSRDVLTLDPEAAVARFAHVVTLQPEAVHPEGFTLAGRTPELELSFDYGADGRGGVLVSAATLEYEAPSPDDAVAIRRDLRQQLRAKLGKPQLYPAAPDTPYWKLTNRVEVSASEMPSTRSGPHGRKVMISISESDGP